jgi:hypothetical protein
VSFDRRAVAGRFGIDLAISSMHWPAPPWISSSTLIAEAIAP